MKTLKDTPIGKTAKVKKVNGEGALRRRIMDMGITKGVEIYVKKGGYVKRSNVLFRVQMPYFRDIS